MLEKVAAEYADKGVVLAKINVDEEQFIAAQFQVRSIPTVYAMFQGQPVADLTNARSESQLKQLLDQLLEKLPIEGGRVRKPQDIAPLHRNGRRGAWPAAMASVRRASSRRWREMAPDNAAGPGRPDPGAGRGREDRGSQGRCSTPCRPSCQADPR